jgi:glutamate synthase domain-containing protein 3
MSGGEAFILATIDELNAQLGPTDLRPRALDREASQRLHGMLMEHVAATGSPRAAELLAHWPATAAQFVHLAPGLPVPAPTRPVEPAVSVPSPR